LKVLGEHGEPPLPRNNFRFGHPTPQNGVEVERKWKRPDYYLPGTRNGALEKLRKLPSLTRTSENGEHALIAPDEGGRASSCAAKTLPGRQTYSNPRPTSASAPGNDGSRGRDPSRAIDQADAQETESTRNDRNHNG